MKITEALSGRVSAVVAAVLGTVVLWSGMIDGIDFTQDDADAVSGALGHIAVQVALVWSAISDSFTKKPKP